LAPPRFPALLPSGPLWPGVTVIKTNNMPLI
jgi:hypothetical protein